MMSFHDLMIAPFEFEFMRHALVLALVNALVCGSLGVLLIPRGLSLLGDGLAHATLGGLGGALLMGCSPEVAVWMAMPFAVFVALGIGWLSQNSRMTSDSALGVFFAVSLAAGICAVHWISRRGVSVDMEGLLFGNILTARVEDVRAVGFVGVIVFVTLFFVGPRMAYAGFYPDLAAMSGIRVKVKDYLLMALAAVVTVTAVRAVGVLLVSSFLIIPMATSRFVLNRLGPMFLLSAFFGMIGSAFGLLLSYHFDVPTGAAMTLVLGGIFSMVVLLRGLLRGRT